MRSLPLALLLFCLLPAVAQPASQIILHDLHEAEALGDDLYQNTGATGLVLVVVRGNQVYFHGYGQTAPGSGITPDQDSVVRICSLTKVFTADLLAKMVSDGAVRLDDPLAKYAPAGATMPENAATITLEELATHTSGLTREIGTAPRKTPHFTYPDYATRWQWLATTELKFQPGTQALYSNVGFDLLGDALAQAAHTPFATLLATRTLQPLRMWNTTFYPNADQCSRLLQTAHNEGPCTTTENTEGSSGLYSTPADMTRWLQYLAGVESLAALTQRDSAHAIYLLPANLSSQYGLDHAGRPSGIGLAWMHLRDNDDLSHLIEKTGGGAGFTTYIAIHPASHTALFVAATDGPRGWKPGFNLFKASNNGLLALAGLPPLPDEHRRRSASRQIVVSMRVTRTKQLMKTRTHSRPRQKRGSNRSSLKP